MPILIRPAAAADMDGAFLWYERQRPGFGEEFLLEIDFALNKILAQPAMYPLIYRDLRRALVKRFPYGIFYRIDQDRIVVIACLHARRDPGEWKRRM